MQGSTQEVGAELIETLSEHTDVESAGDGGNGKVACWLELTERSRDDVKHNLTLLANAHGFEYAGGSMEQHGYIVLFEPSDE